MANAQTSYEKVVAVRQYLQDNIGYTMKIERTPDVAPVYDFLFNQKAGHCELFASSMAVLLRTLGIPARVVNGYRGVLWNSYGNFYLIRQRDAHCWVEVFFDRDIDPFNRNEIGWVRFDPTPSAPLDDRGLASTVTDFFSYLRLKWIDHVISYSAVEQRKIAVEVRQSGRRMRGWFSRLFASIRDFFSRPAGDLQEKVLRGILIAIPPAVLVIALILLRRSLRTGGGRRRKYVRARDASVAFYRDFLKILKRAGLRRKYSQTPSEFARVISVSVPKLSEPAWTVTSKFLEIRFGAVQPGTQDLATVNAAIAQLSTAVTAMRVARRAGRPT